MTAIVVAIACVFPAGCVQRRMMVRSNPPGAVVYIDDYEIGTTPVAANFTYYGTRKIRLVKNGYETLTIMQPVPAPWYQFTPLDFIAENLIPGKIHDTRTFDYPLVPQLVVPPEQLLDRAEGLRRETRASGTVQTSPPLRAGPPPRGASPTTAPLSIAPSAAAPPVSPTQPAASGASSPAPSFGPPPSAWPPSGG
jgi:hypothetical protein